MPVHLVAVEADPVHFGWMRQHFADNGIDPSRHTLIRAAVANGTASLPFLMGSPQGTEHPHEWYGQVLGDWAGEIVDRDAGLYGGFPVRVHENGWRSIETPQTTLEDVLRDVAQVDLMHIDIQGVECEVLEAAMNTVNSKVKRMCIGTHSRQIEGNLERLLTRNGWKCGTAHPCGETSETPWGPVPFVDGIQRWINPRRNRLF